MAESRTPSLSLRELAEALGAELAGEPDIPITGVATLASAQAGELAFLTSPRHRRELSATRASAVILSAAAADATPLPRLIVENPYLAYARAVGLFHPPLPVLPGIHPAAVIDSSASIAPDAAIGACVVIGPGSSVGARAQLMAGTVLGSGASVGADTRLHPRVVVCDGCRIGARVIVHSGAVIGADGFGFAADDGKWFKIPQVGIVIIGDDVEIGAGTTIDRGALDNTVIEDGVKLDNQIQIGHNCRIGAHTAVAGCVGIAGSVRIGRHCRIGGAAMISGHIEIADNVTVSGGTLVSGSITSPGVYTGVYPLARHDDWLSSAPYVKRLRDLAQRIRALEAKLGTKGGPK